MKIKVWIEVVIVLVVSMIATVSGALAETITKAVNGSTVTWRIDEPRVDQPMTPYPEIRFMSDDQVTLAADGCVQTGGSGKTWKSYVHPQGPNSDHLYHGLVSIPALFPLSRFASRTGSFTVQAGADASKLFLQLGYEDDNYGGNGYTGHDDGTQDQCKGVGNAFVTVTDVRPISSKTQLRVLKPQPADTHGSLEDPQGHLFVTIVFNEPVIQASVVVGKTLFLEPKPNSSAAGTLKWSADGRTVTFTTTQVASELLKFQPDAGFRLILIGTDHGNGVIKSVGGQILDGDYDGNGGGDYQIGFTIVG